MKLEPGGLIPWKDLTWQQKLERRIIEGRDPPRARTMPKIFGCSWYEGEHTLEDGINALRKRLENEGFSDSVAPPITHEMTGGYIKSGPFEMRHISAMDMISGIVCHRLDVQCING